MSKEITNRFKKLILHDDDNIFYVQLEENLRPLRTRAHEIADFIHGLSYKSDQFDMLEQSYRQLEALPVCDLSLGIHAIKESVANINFYSKDKLIMKQADVVAFFEKQNQFNAEANRLVATVIQMDAVR